MIAVKLDQVVTVDEIAKEKSQINKYIDDELASQDTSKDNPFKYEVGISESNPLDCMGF